MRDQVRDHFGVGVGFEPRLRLLQLFLQLGVIFDDAVMDDGDAVGRVRVGVILVRPPCVAQRVWPMPTVPGSGDFFSFLSRLISLPSARRRS
jgi:hypothetical protein